MNGIIFVISKALTDSEVSNDEFDLVNDVLNEYDNMKEKIQNRKSKCLNKL